VSLLLTLCILTFYLWHLTETARLGLAIGDLKIQLNKVQNEIDTLETKKAALLSLGRVEKVAKEDLQMTEPQPGQVVYENDEGTQK
jgi:cell division protein FtsL